MSGVLTPASEGYVDVVVGTQMGDEGKGGHVHRMVSEGYDIVARFNGGSNAGHELGGILTVHQVPSGITTPGVLNIIGNGSLLDPVRLREEIDYIVARGFKVSPKNLVISDTAHLVLPHHILLDGLREAGKGRQGSTKAGISFVAADKYGRKGKRAETLLWDPEGLRKTAMEGLKNTNQLIKDAKLPADHPLKTVSPAVAYREWFVALKSLQAFIKDTVELLNDRLARGAHVLAEGAQSVGLDIEHGIYPLGTSSHATPGGAMNGLGFSHAYIRKVIGVAKLTESRVGGDLTLFLTRVKDARVAARLRGQRGTVDGEYGKTSGRPREMGYPDLVKIRRAVKVAGVNELILTKLDLVPRFGKTVKLAIAYDIGGEVLTMAPNSALKLAACKPRYIELPTWSEDISAIRDYQKLPAKAKKLVEAIEKQVGVHVGVLGVGPERDQVILRD